MVPSTKPPLPTSQDHLQSHRSIPPPSTCPIFLFPVVVSVPIATPSPSPPSLGHACLGHTLGASRAERAQRLGLLRNPAAVFLPDSSLPPFYPRPPHWSPRLLSFVRSRLNWYLEMSIAEQARGYECVETTRPRTKCGRLGEVDISSGAGPRCGWRMREGLQKADRALGPGENQWACGVSGSVGWELRAEADDLQAAGRSSTILCNAEEAHMLASQWRLTTTKIQIQHQLIQH